MRIHSTFTRLTIFFSMGALAGAFSTLAAGCGTDPPGNGRGGTGGQDSGTGGRGGSAGSGGFGGSGGTGGTGGGGGSPGCNVPPEPNETEATAGMLAGIDECDSNGSTLTGVVNGTSDIDFYHYVGTPDATFCEVDPQASTDSPNLELCMYWSCRGGVPTTGYCQSGTDAQPPPGAPADQKGCCIATPGYVHAFDICNNTGGTADVYIRLRSPMMNVCLPYTVTYHF
ncbi:MAG TPA: hypothetical protein VKN99_26880 [Polyangia bacterium]|nr:hypothetical protein [Polyangia bacterium]